MLCQTAYNGRPYKKKQTRSPDRLLINYDQEDNRKHKRRVNYQKGGGGGAFKRKHTVGAMLETIRAQVAKSSNGSTQLSQVGYIESGLCSVNSYSKSKNKQLSSLADTYNILGEQNVMIPGLKSMTRDNRETNQDQIKCFSIPSHVIKRNSSELALESGNSVNEKESEQVKESDKKSNPILGNTWFKLVKEGDFHMPKYSINNKFIKPMHFPLSSSNFKKQVVSTGNAIEMLETMNINSLEVVKKHNLQPKHIQLIKEELKYTDKKTNTINETKKQILQELMKINDIPASYFIYGREANKNGLDIGLNEIADLVDITSNKEGDIVIKRRNSSSFQALPQKRHRYEFKEGEECYKRAITVKKIQINEKHPQSRHVVYRNVLQSNITGTRPIGSGSKKARNADSLNRNSQFSRTTRLEGKKILRTEREENTIRPIEANRTPLKEKNEGKTHSTKIKILHEPDEHHFNHPINTIIRLINEFGAACFKIKPEGCINKSLLLVLSKKLGLNLNKAQICDVEFWKVKENILSIKEKLLRRLFNVINKENNISIEQIKVQGNYKFFVGNGNNPLLVKSVLKQRCWWNQGDLSENSNLVWTQWKKPKIMESIPCIAINSNLAKRANSLGQNPEESTSTDTADPTSNTNINKSIIPQHNTAQGKSPSFNRIHNHVEGNIHLGNKKALYYNLKNYYEALKKRSF